MYGVSSSSAESVKREREYNKQIFDENRLAVLRRDTQTLLIDNKNIATTEGEKSSSRHLL